MFTGWFDKNKTKITLLEQLNQSIGLFIWTEGYIKVPYTLLH